MNPTLLPLFLALASQGAEPAPADRSPAAVIAADHAWSDAEQRGDVAFLEWLLEPGYRSVGRDGKVAARAALLSSAAKRRAQPTDGDSAALAAWRAAHPNRVQVDLFGDTAVLSFVSTKEGSIGAVNSSDVFVYRDGHWHPIYSQHSDAGT